DRDVVGDVGGRRPFASADTVVQPLDGELPACARLAVLYLQAEGQGDVARDVADGEPALRDVVVAAAADRAAGEARLVCVGRVEEMGAQHDVVDVLGAGRVAAHVHADVEARVGEVARVEHDRARPGGDSARDQLAGLLGAEADAAPGRIDRPGIVGAGPG